MADTEVRVEVRTMGTESIATIVRPDTGEPLGEVCRCTVSAFRSAEVVEAWKAFVKLAAHVVIANAIEGTGAKIHGWAESAPGEPRPSRTIPLSERN